MHGELNLLSEIDLKNLTEFMLDVYRGKLFPLSGRPDHFEDADDDCIEGPFVRTSTWCQPDVKEDFQIKNEK